MKHDILRMLTETQEYLSGEEIARRLGISRTAVWKHIDALKKMGYPLLSKPNKGYRLESVPNLLLPELILAQTEGKPWQIHYEEQTESTNETAKVLAQNGAAHGTVVVSEGQTKGKGRMARQWHTQSNTGICCSVLLRPPIKPQDAAKLPLIAGLAVQQALTELVPQPIRLKWPNDVVCDGKKLCGILCEMEAEPDAVRYVVVGIGINVNEVTFPPEIREIASSLQILAGKPLCRAQVLARVLERFFALYEGYIAAGDLRETMLAYSQVSALNGREIVVTAWGKEQHGICVGFDKEGALVLEQQDGSRVRVLSGDVSIRRRDKAYV